VDKVTAWYGDLLVLQVVGARWVVDNRTFSEYLACSVKCSPLL
jgi:hypothetical protein